VALYDDDDDDDDNNNIKYLVNIILYRYDEYRNNSDGDAPASGPPPVASERATHNWAMT
jgi:hypothetical protein